MAADAAHNLRKVCTIGDEIVSMRAFDDSERAELLRRGKGRFRHLCVALGYLALALGLGLGTALVQWQSDLGVVSLFGFVVMVGSCLVRAQKRWRRARLAAALSADLAQGEVFVFESLRGRNERLAATGRLWRTGDESAPWRNEA